MNKWKLNALLFLFHGTKPGGAFRQKERADAKAIGDWMKINSAAT